MQMTHRNDLESIFLQALEFGDVAQREAFLDEQCGEDASLRGEIGRLLRSHAVAESFLNGKSPNLRATEYLAGGARNESVLGVFKDVLGQTPSIALRESDEQYDPVQRPSSPEIPPMPVDGRYQLQGEIARGGMGVVIKGRDTDLGRDLAVKVLLDSHKDRPEVTQRFIEEAQIGGQLQHPGIAPVYELGQFEDQRPYFTMKLVKGKTLAALLANRKSIEEDRSKFIGIFEQICQTMAYAHSRGVIHRDLKPANIMVGAFGEVQVMDWGLAKVLKTGGVADESRPTNLPNNQSVIETLRSGQGDTPLGQGSQTQMGSVMGTPAYMPPEQALGEIDQLDERCDVFGLGAILCEILTGEPPYVAENNVELFRMATRGKLEHCHERLEQAGVDDDLLALTKQCLLSEPKYRPLHAGELSVQVTMHIETVASRLRESEIDLAAQSVRFVEEQKRRKLTLVSGTAIAVLIAGLGVGGFWLQQQQTQAAEAVAATQKERADEEREAKEQVREILYGSQIAVAQAAIDRGDLSRAARVLNSLRPVGGEPDLRGFEWHMLQRRCMHPLETRDLGWEQSHEEYMGQRISRTFWHALSGDRRTYANLVTDDQGMTRLRVRNLESGESINEIEIGKVGIYRERSSDHFVALNDDATLAAVFCGAEADDEKPYDNLRVIEIQTGEVMVEHSFENGDTVGRAFLRFDRRSQCVGIVQNSLA